MRVRTLTAVAVQTALLAAAIVFAPTSAAQASAGRVFVAGTGNDGNTSNNCALATPCRTFAMALTVTNAGGEIVALDTAGYGEVTISGSLSIIAAASAEVTVAAGTTGITINAAAGDNIILENLVINCGNAANTTGIALNTGHLTLLDSTVKLCATGLLDNNSKADIVNSKILGNSVAVQTNGTGLNPANTGGANSGLTEVRIYGGSILNNPTGFLMNNPGLAPAQNPGGPQTNNVTIFTNFNVVPNIAGSATIATVSGTGSACSTQMVGGTTFNDCTNGSTYSYEPGFNQQ